MCGRQETGEINISGSQSERCDTHEGDQGNPNFTNLLDDALCCAIVPYRDNPVVSPPDIEDTTHGLQKIEHEEGELSREFNEPSMGTGKTSGRPCRRQQAPGTTSSHRVETSSYTTARSTMQHLVKQEKHVKGNQPYADPDKYDNDANGTNERCFGCYL
jgi:hypothetical protein